MAAVLTAGRQLTISLLYADTPNAACRDLPDRFYQQFTAPHPRDPKIGRFALGCSILLAPPSIDDYWASPHAYWMRQRVRRAEREGYEFAEIDRNSYLEDIFAINTSLDARQGHPMTEEYRERPVRTKSLSYACPNHALVFYGITRGGHLYAYAWVYQVGEMSFFSQILGHGDHLKAGIMPFLIFNVVSDRMQVPSLKYVMYNLHRSGTPGLRFFKEQLGFSPYDVDWRRGDEQPGVASTPAQDSKVTWRTRIGRTLHRAR